VSDQSSVCAPGRPSARRAAVLVKMDTCAFLSVVLTGVRRVAHEPARVVGVAVIAAVRHRWGHP
jgi:hypothetical protein